jgi:hypothetical protein
VCQLATLATFDGSALSLEKAVLKFSSKAGSFNNFTASSLPNSASARCSLQGTQRATVRTLRENGGVTCEIETLPFGRKKTKTDRGIIEGTIALHDGIDTSKWESPVAFYDQGMYGPVEIYETVLLTSGQVYLHNDGIYKDVELNVKCRFTDSVQDELAIRSNGIFVCTASAQTGNYDFIAMVVPIHPGYRVPVEATVFIGNFDVAYRPEIVKFEPLLVISSEPRVNVKIELKFSSELHLGPALGFVYCEIDGVRTGRAICLNQTTVSCDLHSWDLDGYVDVQLNIAGLTIKADQQLEVRDRRAAIVDPPQRPVKPPTNSFDGFPEVDLRKMVLLDNVRLFPLRIVDEHVRISLLGLWPTWPKDLLCLWKNQAGVEVSGTLVIRLGAVRGECEVDASTDSVYLVIVDANKVPLSKSITFREASRVSALTISLTPTELLFTDDFVTIDTADSASIVGCSFGESGQFVLREPGALLVCEVPTSDGDYFYLHYSKSDFRFNTGIIVDIINRPQVTRILQTGAWELELEGNWSALWSKRIPVLCVVGGIQTPGSLLTSSRAKCDLRAHRWMPGKHQVHLAYSDGLVTSLVVSYAFITFAEPSSLSSREFTTIVAVNSTYVSPLAPAAPKKRVLPTLPLHKPS